MSRLLSTCSLAALVACGSASDGTFVLVQFQRGTAPAETTRIDLTVELAGKSAMVPVENDDKSSIDFPKTKSLEVASGSGTMMITAVARDAAGTEVGRGTAMTDIVRAQVAMATVTFGTAPTGPRLTVVSENRGVGTGFVVVNPLGTNCSNNTCIYDFKLGETVELVATPGANTTFVGWAGDCTGTASCSLTMDGPKQISAAFAAYELTVKVTGTGTVTFSNPVATCPTACTQIYGGASESVTLTATPGTGQAFGGWTGACTGFVPCTLLMDATRTVSATFGAARNLTITKAGGGQGVVSSDDGAIDCGTSCQHDYIDGSMVTLTATPETGHVFTGFTPAGNCVTSVANTCVLTMDAAKSMTATFTVKGIDLVIDSLTCSVTTVTDNSPVSCTAVIKNLGDTASPATTMTLYQSRDNKRDSGDRGFGSCSVATIPSGGRVNVTCTGSWPIQAIYGPVFIVAVVDPSNIIGEASEANNQFPFAVTSFAGGFGNTAQLVATGLTCTPTAGNAASTVTCMFTVFNASDTITLPKSSTIKSILRLSTDTNFSTGDPQIGTCADISSSNNLPSGMYKTLACTGTIPAGQAPGTQVYIVGETNYQGSSTNDGDRDDNYAGIPYTVTVPGVIDIKAQSLACTPAASAGAAVNCKLSAINIGETGAAPFAVELRYSADTTIDGADTLLSTCNIPASLQGGQSASVTCTGNVPAAATTGIGYLGVILDRTMVNADGNLANNTASSALRVGADIIVSGISCGPVARGSATSCTVNLTNQGSEATAAFSSQLRWSTDNIIDTTDSTLGVPCNALGMQPGTTQTITCSGTVPSVAIGNYYIGVIADSAGVITEASETNNTGYTGYVVGPDLYAAGAGCPSTVVRGTVYTCSNTVYNIGSESTGGSFIVAIRYSTDSTIDASDPVIGTCTVNAIPANSSSTFSCSINVPTGFAAGVAYVAPYADAQNTVAEVNETNNQVSYDFLTVN